MFTKTSLPQYFFGDVMNRGDKSANNNSIVEDFHLSEPNLSRIPSPASSLASTKKLEWDSGADIGYNVYNSFKTSRRSKSFPALNMDLSISQINKSDETQGDEISVENKVTDENNKIKNSKCNSQLKPQDSKRKRNFIHSTPYEEKMVTKKSEKDKFKSTNENNDECLQTTLIKICSRSVQTDNINNEKVNRSQQTDTINTQSSSSGSSLSKSSSFQYIPGSNKSKSTTKNSDITRTCSSRKTESILSETTTNNSTASKNSSVKSENTSETFTSTTNHEESHSSNASPLGKIIAAQQSQNLITDIDHSLNILQKFITSKNYTPETKKYYARKIVTKIITNKYKDDSSTSLSVSNSNLSSNRSNELPIEPNIKSKSNDSIDVNNFINKENIKSNKISCAVQCGPMQKTVSTETSNNEIAEKLEKLVLKNSKFTEESKRKTRSDIQLSKKKWKDAETLSEKLFEARKKSLESSRTTINIKGTKIIDINKKDDYLIQHSKNERKRQLSWINNEISYLHRLKELLQTSSSNVSEAGSKKSQPSANKSQSITTNNSSISDIEIKFYQEFGSTNASKITEELSKLLTTDQIKLLIDNDIKKLHFQLCECCKRTQIITPQTTENKSGETNQNKSSLEEVTSHDINNCSFNSHSYKFYENLIRSCNASKQNSPKGKSNIHEQNQISKKLDAGIQCTLKKKKYPPQLQYNTNYSPSDYSEENEKRKVQVFYENVSNFNYCDSQSTEYGRIEPQTPDFIVPHKSGKENYYHRPNTFWPKPSAPAKPIAYFLTFEEESMSEYAEKSLKINELENVTVKIPKFVQTSKKRAISQSKKKVSNLSLQDYLAKNRPQFVQTADWRRSIISDLTTRKSKNIFTCSQMKNITSKKYIKLPEVQNKIHLCKVLDQKRHYRCMAKDFSKKLQKKTLKGQMSIATCVNVMSSDSH